MQMFIGKGRKLCWTKTSVLHFVCLSNFVGKPGLSPCGFQSAWRSKCDENILRYFNRVALQTMFSFLNAR